MLRSFRRVSGVFAGTGTLFMHCRGAGACAVYVFVCATRSNELASDFGIRSDSESANYVTCLELEFVKQHNFTYFT